MQAGVSSQGAAGRQILAKGVLPAPSEASLNAATLPLRASQSVRRPPPLSGRRQAALGAMAAGVVVAGALIGVVCARGLLRHDAAPSVVSVASPTLRPFVSVALRASAPKAHFRFEDGREVASPYVGLVPRGDRAQIVWVEANGFLPKKISILPSDDVTIDDIHLVAIDSDPVRALGPGHRAGEHNLLAPRPAPKR